MAICKCEAEQEFEPRSPVHLACSSSLSFVAQWFLYLLVILYVHPRLLLPDHRGRTFA